MQLQQKDVIGSLHINYTHVDQKNFDMKQKETHSSFLFLIFLTTLLYRVMNNNYQKAVQNVIQQLSFIKSKQNKFTFSELSHLHIKKCNS